MKALSTIGAVLAWIVGLLLYGWNKDQRKKKIII